MKKLLIIFFSLIVWSGVAQDISFRQRNFLLEKNVAVGGFDPVSYQMGKPQKGTIKLMHEGISYFFVSQANLEVFKQNPQKFEPAYGGWCAYAMGIKGQKVEVDFENYKLLNGRLYLFYRNRSSNTLDDWNKNEKHLKSTADINWSKLK